jgi:hypothetical protein
MTSLPGKFPSGGAAEQSLYIYDPFDMLSSMNSPLLPVEVNDGKSIIDCIVRAAEDHRGVQSSTPRDGNMVILFGDGCIGLYEMGI